MNVWYAIQTKHGLLYAMGQPGNEWHYEMLLGGTCLTTRSTLKEIVGATRGIKAAA